MRKSKRFYAFVVIVISVFLVLKNNQDQFMSLLTNSNTAEFPQKKLDASWQFSNVKTWQLPNKQEYSTQTYSTSQKITFQNTSETSEIKDLLIIQEKPTQTFIINSELATTTASQTIEFSNNVVIEIVDKKNNQVQTLNTDKITYNDSDKIITSDTLTSLKQKGLSITGDQFSGNLNTRDYEFKGNVKTILKGF